MPNRLPLQHRLRRAVRAFLWPDPRNGNLIQAARERLLIQFSLLAGVGGTATALAWWNLAALLPLTLSLALLGGLSLFLVPVHFHLTGAFRRSAWMLVLLYVAPILSTSLATGGLLAGTTLYLLAAPVIAGLLLGMRPALLVGGAVFLAVVALYLGQEQLNPPVHRMAPRAMAFSYGYAMAILVLGLAAAIGTFQAMVDRTNRALDRARVEAEAANEARAQFLANMTHELRTPLNGILGFADLLAGRDLDEEARDHLRHIRGSGRDLLALVNDVLDFSRAETGALRLEAVPVDLPALLAELQQRFLPRCAAKGLAFSATLEPEVPPLVSGDPLRLRQVIGNLLDNAVKFTDAGSVRLTVGLDGMAGTPAPAGDGTSGPVATLRFTVADTGPGIPAAALATLFDRFTQADSSTTRRYGGSGLGLAIVHTIAGLMGGTAGVESRPGAGSRFWATARLPVLAVAAQGEAAATAAAPPRQRRARHPGDVLVVEDSPTNQDLFRTVLTGAGHRVQIAPNGQAALQALRRDRFDLVLMDGQMPVMGGLDATRAIRRSGEPFARVTIVALTANALAHDAAAFRDAGMNDYLAKPVDLNLLLDKVDEWIARRQA
ncbi:MAG: ATP-binding protein [Sneathiellaceae bacterium]